MPRIMRCGFAALACVVPLVSVAWEAPQEPKAEPPRPPARRISALTAPDRFPGACVDCHLDYKDMNIDARFETALARWSGAVGPKLLEKAQAAAPKRLKLVGKHPPVPPATLKNIPRSCLACHGKESKTAPSFARMLHAIHLTGGEESAFLTLFQGECTHCHKLDAKSGMWSVPSGPEK